MFNVRHTAKCQMVTPLVTIWTFFCPNSDQGGHHLALGGNRTSVTPEKLQSTYSSVCQCALDCSAPSLSLRVLSVKSTVNQTRYHLSTFQTIGSVEDQSQTVLSRPHSEELVTLLDELSRCVGCK